MNDNDLLASALFSRGWTRMEWGLYGTIEQGMFQIQQDQLEAAIRDFRRAKDLFPTVDGREVILFCIGDAVWHSFLALK